MIFHEFPDLAWVQRQAAQGFSNRLGWNNLRLDTEGFPSVVINARSHECFRPGIKGPFSFFLNLRGGSLCSVEGQTTRIESAHYFVSNRAQLYTLQIEKGSDTETFNIHFGEVFAGSVLNALITPADRILEHGTDKQLTDFRFFNQLHHRDAVFNGLVDQIRQSYRSNGFDKWLFEEQLSALLAYHLQQHRRIADTVGKLPPVKQATRVELYKRLSRAMDTLQSSPADTLSLDALAAEACLSKYHFLRLFRQLYGLSPWQYLQQLRVEKARRLLSGTQLPVAELAGLLGFDNSQSFSRLFRQRVGVYPSQYRAMAK